MWIGQPVGVKQAVEVVVLVLEDASQPPARFDLERGSPGIHRPQDRPLGSPQRKTRAGYREATLGLGVLICLADRHRGDPEFRIHGGSALDRAVLVAPVPHEDAQRHAHLREQPGRRPERRPSSPPGR